jgi:hypothetical protein
MSTYERHLAHTRSDTVGSQRLGYENARIRSVLMPIIEMAKCEFS